MSNSDSLDEESCFMDESDTNQEKAGSHANTTTSTCGDGKLYWNPRLRKDMPPLREDSEFVDLSHLEAMKAPIYECTHSYVDKIVLKCNSCSRWAVVNPDLPYFRLRPGPGDRGYSFQCSECGGGKQQFQHTEKTWLDITLTCLYNMELLDRDKEGHRFFHVRKEICKFADEHWDQICKGRNRTTTWWATLNAQITTRLDLFETAKHGSGRWALVYSNISHHRPFEMACSKKPDRKGSKKSDKDRFSKLIPMPLPALPSVDQIKEETHTITDEEEEHSGRSSPRKRATANWCHQCKGKHEQVVHCDGRIHGPCNKKFCRSCIERHYPNDKIQEATNLWTCPYCRNVCTCATCRRRKEEQANNTDPMDVDKAPEKVEAIIARRVKHQSKRSPTVSYLLRLSDSPQEVWVDVNTKDQPPAYLAPHIKQFDESLRIKLPITAALLGEANSTAALSESPSGSGPSSPRRSPPRKKKRLRNDESDSLSSSSVTEYRPAVTEYRPSATEYRPTSSTFDDLATLFTLPVDEVLVDTMTALDTRLEDSFLPLDNPDMVVEMFG